MELGLKGKNVIVVGGTGGMGEYIVKQFADQGCSVVVADIDQAIGDTFLKSLNYPNVFFHRTDLSKTADVDALYTYAVKQLGHVDIIVQTAKLFEFAFFKDWKEVGRLERQFSVFNGMADLIRQAWVKKPAGQRLGVVCISSVVGARWGERKAVAYGAVNAAYEGFGASLATEMGNDGWIVTIAPGHTWTKAHINHAQNAGLSKEAYEAQAINIQHTSVKRHINPEEIAGVVLFSSSPIYGPLFSGKTLTPDFVFTGGAGVFYRE
jgi:NAD(P)-dependent dehydrogenase (short-subunit alcohol dehydrogenase family)